MVRSLKQENRSPDQPEHKKQIIRGSQFKPQSHKKRRKKVRPYLKITTAKRAGVAVTQAAEHLPAKAQSPVPSKKVIYKGKKVFCKQESWGAHLEW
jgi:hypothetical protein